MKVAELKDLIKKGKIVGVKLKVGEKYIHLKEGDTISPVFKQDKTENVLVHDGVSYPVDLIVYDDKVQGVEANVTRCTTIWLNAAVLNPSKCGVDGELRRYDKDFSIEAECLPEAKRWAEIIITLIKEEIGEPVVCATYELYQHDKKIWVMLPNVVWKPRVCVEEKKEEKPKSKDMKIKSISEDKIVFDNGNYLEYEHQQDCCERVYADFKNLQVFTDVGANAVKSDDLVFDPDLTKHITQAEGVGFMIEDKNGVRLFVSCYDCQNGYYSDDLTLIYHNVYTGKVEKIDITECCKKDYE